MPIKFLNPFFMRPEESADKIYYNFPVNTDYCEPYAFDQ